jgi:hypothetical protein
MEDKRSIKKVLESQGDVHEKVANQSNSELPSLSPTQSRGPPRIQIDVQIAYDLRFGRSTYAQKTKEITFSMTPVSFQIKSDSSAIIKTVLISRTVFLLHHHFGPMGSVSSWSPLGMHPRVRP